MSKKTEIEAGLAEVRAAVEQVQVDQDNEFHRLRNEVGEMRRELVMEALRLEGKIQAAGEQHEPQPPEGEGESEVWPSARPEMTSDERITNLEKSLDNLIERFNKLNTPPNKKQTHKGVWEWKAETPSPYNYNLNLNWCNEPEASWSQQEQARMEPEEPAFGIVRLDDDPHSYLQLRVNDARDLFIEDIVYGNYGYSQRSALRMMRFAYEEGQKAERAA